MHPVDIASRTKLPPSPELRPTAHPPLHVIENELDEDDDNDDDTFLSSSPPLPLQNNKAFRRLRSIARYASFRPQALCCSPPIAPSGSGNENLLLASSSTTITAKKYAAQQASSSQQQHGDSNNDNNSTDPLTSVGAICGDKGVALFRVSSPHIPLLLLRHASRPSTSRTSKSTGHGGRGGGVTSLAFQPNCSSARTSQLHLAAARGSSVLVWDASGHSLSPLVGRLGVGHGLSFDLHGGSETSSSKQQYTQITSLAWQQSESATSPWLAAATASHACLWDLRQATAGSAAFAKPSLRFGATAAAASNNHCPYVQLAASGADECALLDAKGVVRIFDLRMPEQQQQHGQARRSSTTVAGILGTFRAFHHAGIGLSYLPNVTTQSGGNNSSTLWLAWGLDGPDSDAVVKIWTRSAGETNPVADVGGVTSTDYWYMDGSPDASRDGSADFRLVSHCTTPNLACARVCPTPDENSFVTIGQEFDSNSATRSNPTKWKAELWKLTEALQLSKIVSFSAGDDANKSITCMDKDASGLGPLIGAELAFSSIPRLVEADVDMEYTMIDKAQIRGLLLVSLTENGYVTTHSIPEAVPYIPIDENPTVAEAAYPSSSIQPRVFPDEKDWAIGDAAAAWGGTSDDMISREVRSTADKSDSRTGPSPIEGGLVPFEMDFPVALPIASDNLNQMPRVDMASPSGLSVAFNDSSPDANATTDENVRDPAALMDDIERIRIPCPRLCGATFSPTIGGLVSFNNGAVKKMWTWYSSSTRTTEAGAAGPAAKLLHGDDAMFPDTKSVKRDSPRTLQDLIEMTKAAKEAQWGDQDSDASSAGTHRMEENFFEDVSDEETSDSDGEVDELTDEPGVKLPKSNMYDQYFGEFRRPLTKPRSSSIESSSMGSKEQAVSKANSGENLAGPSSDMLSPEVIVARAFDRISLNNQSQLLACQLDLGRWTEVIEVMGESSDLDESYHQPTASPRPKKQTLELSSRNRFAPQSPTRNNPIQHATSDPLLVARTPKRLRQQSEVVCTPVTGNVSPYRYVGDERGVRGGEYGVRPNVQESMVFLRKLFTHQQEGGGGYSGLISPPDGPLLPSSLTPPGKRHVNPAVSSRNTAKSNPGPSLPQPGVYTICADGLASRANVRDKLVETRAICLHNAAVCEKLNEQEKADVWELLSQVVDGRLIELAGGNDKWRPRRGNALGTNLVSNILRCYESLGDVQMLSTIVCVLRSKLQDSNRSKICHSDYSLLPAGDDEKYDAWLRIYSDLLYGWGLLSIRAELNKHLVRVIHSRESAAQLTIPKPMDEGRTPGIALVFTCPTCGEDTDIGTNYCRSCHDFAFRCIICDQAVRGLLSVCDKENCRHGGHPSCLKEWFSLHKECPSGCGCNCTLLTPVILSAPEPVVNEFI